MREKSGKKMGKLLGLFILSLVVLGFLINLVSAYPAGSYDPRQGMSDLIDLVVNFFEPLLQVVLGGEMWSGYYLFEALILFIILVGVVYLSLNKVKIFEDNKGVLWIVCIGVPLLGIRFLDIIWFNTIMIQYKVLAIALLAGLPFFIYFFFLNNVFANYAAIRKIGWIFFACIYFGLWITSGVEDYGQIYFWTALASLVFLFLDGTISKYIMLQKVRENQAQPIMQRIAELDQAAQLIESASSLSTDEKEHQKKKIKKQIDRLRKQLA